MTASSRRAALSWSLGAGLGVLLAVRPIAAAPAGQSGPVASGACRAVADLSRAQYDGMSR